MQHMPTVKKKMAPTALKTSSRPAPEGLDSEDSEACSEVSEEVEGRVTSASRF